MAYATANDVIVRWGKAEVADEINALIGVRLGDAERMIERGLKSKGLTTLADRIDTDLTSEEDAIQVEAEMVLRLVRNPEGYLSETDGDYTYMLRQDLASGKLEVTPDDWETLGVSVGSGFYILMPTPVMPT